MSDKQVNDAKTGQREKDPGTTHIKKYAAHDQKLQTHGDIATVTKNVNNCSWAVMPRSTDLMKCPMRHESK